MFPNAQPKFFKACAVPYILKEKIENELDRLMSQGVIEPVQFAPCSCFEGGWNCSHLWRLIPTSKNPSGSPEEILSRACARLKKVLFFI